MCLYIESDEKRKEFIDQAYVICYKRLRNIMGRLQSIFQYTIYKPGENRAWPETATVLNEDGNPAPIARGNLVYGGAIHLWINKPKDYDSGEVVTVPFKCYLKDLIAVGDEDVCFKAVHLSQEDYDEAFNVSRNNKEKTVVA